MLTNVILRNEPGASILTHGAAERSSSAAGGRHNTSQHKKTPAAARPLKHMVGPRLDRYEPWRTVTRAEEMRP